MVNVPGVTLETLTVHGDLLIGDGVADGDVTLRNVTVTGRTVVRGGGGDSIHITGDSQIGALIVRKVDGEVRIQTEDGAEVATVYIDDGCDDVILTGVFDEVVLGVGVRVVAADAQIERAVIDGVGSALVVADGSIVIKATVAAGAENARIEGGGFVLNAEVKANGANVETLGTQVRVDYGLTGVKAGASPLPAGTKVTTKAGQAAAPDTEPPVLGGITPESGEQNLTDSRTLQLTVTAADDAALLELEILHNISGLPKLVFTASKANPYGFGGAKKQIMAAGITVTFNQGVWAIDFGAAITEQMKASRDEVTLLFTVKDTAGLSSAAVNHMRRYTVCEKYTIAFKAGPGGSLEPGDQHTFSSIPKGAAWGSAVTVPRPLPGDHYSFNGWTPDFPATVTADANFTAQFLPKHYSLSYYELTGATVTPNPTSYTVETNTFTLNNPSKGGYSFAGWTGTGLSKMEEIVTVAKGSHGSREYTAHFTKETYWIIYGLGGGVPGGENPATYDVESRRIVLINPSKEGYTFAGWTGTGLSAVTPLVVVATGSFGNRSYEAHYTPISYLITYSGLDVAVISGNPISYHIESASFTLPQPTKAGYTFTGWTGTGLGSQTMNVTVPKGSMGPRNYTAHFTKDTYSIGYELGGGAVGEANPTAYDVESETFTLVNPTKEGYTFAGWAGTALDEATLTVTVAQGSTGDRAYTAHFTKDTYSIGYELSGGAVGEANPATYNVESETFTLVNPTKEGYTFTGWTGTGLDEATLTVTVAQGSTGDRTYTAHFVDTVSPAEVTVTPTKDSALKLRADESFVLTVSAKDAGGLYELEIDHNLTGAPYGLPEFSVYASEDNPYGSLEDKALFEGTYGVSVTYEENEGEGAWAIDFGLAITGKLIAKGNPVFYLVVKDTSGNAWGSMDEVSKENTFGYTVGRYTPMEIVETISPFVAGVPSTFTIGTVANDDAYRMVRAYFTLPEGVTLEYQEGGTGPWIGLEGAFGPAAGFPLGNITTTFRGTVAAAGTYDVTVLFKELSGAVVGSKKISFAAVAPADLSEIVAEQSETFFAAFYNEFEQQIFETLDEQQSAAYYVEIGDYSGAAPVGITINGESYGTEPSNLSIGKNSHIRVPVWKIEDGKLYVALPWLCVDALPGTDSLIVAGATTFKVQVYAAATSGTLTIDIGTPGGAVALGNKGNLNEVGIAKNGDVYTVTEKTDHYASYVGLEIKDGGQTIDGTSAMIFRRNLENNEMGITKGEKANITYAVYGKYANAPVTTPEPVERSFKLAIPGHGVLNVNFQFDFVTE